MVAVIRFIDKYLGNAVCNLLGMFGRNKNKGKKDPTL